MSIISWTIAPRRSGIGLSSSGGKMEQRAHQRLMGNLSIAIVVEADMTQMKCSLLAEVLLLIYVSNS